MRRFVDLHVHSTASDGTFSPARIIAAADGASLAAVALCDHDTVAGLAEAQREAEKYGELLFVPGVELSAVSPSHTTGTLHILGLGVDPTAGGLAALLRRLRESREQRNPRMLAKLNGLGIDITLDEVLAVVGGTRNPADRVVSRVHIAETLVRKGAAADIGEAFRKYVAAGAAAWVDKERINAAEAIAAVRGAGGAAVLAHPAQLRCRNTAHLLTLLKRWVGAGLNGIECYHPVHSSEQVRRYIDLARSLDLLITGGSDFHGRGMPSAGLGRPRVPAAAVEDILSRYGPG